MKWRQKGAELTNSTSENHYLRSYSACYLLIPRNNTNSYLLQQQSRLRYHIRLRLIKSASKLTNVHACVDVPFRSCDRDLAFMSICFWFACFVLLWLDKFKRFLLSVKLRPKKFTILLASYQALVFWHEKSHLQVVKSAQLLCWVFLPNS